MKSRLENLLEPEWQEARQINAFFNIVVIGEGGLRPGLISGMLIFKKTVGNDIVMRKKALRSPVKVRRLKHAAPAPFLLFPYGTDEGAG